MANSENYVDKAKKRADVQLRPDVKEEYVPKGGIREAMAKSATVQRTGKPSNDSTQKSAVPMSLKKGGKIKKTGKALVHKGEVVLNKKQQKKVGKVNIKKAIKKTR